MTATLERQNGVLERMKKQTIKLGIDRGFHCTLTNRYQKCKHDRAKQRIVCDQTNKYSCVKNKSTFLF